MRFEDPNDINQDLEKQARDSPLGGKLASGTPNDDTTDEDVDPMEIAEEETDIDEAEVLEGEQDASEPVQGRNNMTEEVLEETEESSSEKVDSRFDPEVLNEVGEMLGAGIRYRDNNRLEFFLDYMDVMSTVDVETTGLDVKRAMKELDRDYSSDKLKREFDRLQDLNLADSGLRHTAYAAGLKKHVIDPLLEYVDDEAEKLYEDEVEGIEGEVEEILEDKEFLGPEDVNVPSPERENFFGVSDELYEDIVSETEDNDEYDSERNVRIVSELLSNLYKPIGGNNKAGVLLEYAEKGEFDAEIVADGLGHEDESSVYATISHLDGDGFLEGDEGEKELTALGEKTVECLETFYNETRGYLND